MVAVLPGLISSKDLGFFGQVGVLVKHCGESEFGVDTSDTLSEPPWYCTACVGLFNSAGRKRRFARRV